MIHGTYRFQFNRNFTFQQAIALIPYLKALGVSHCYASPLLKAREGSPHGYDITDHQQLNQEIGSPKDFETLAEALNVQGMGLILDIVPNHMGAGKDNPWWMDVLENGPSSLYADYFDIDWHPMTEDLQNKILLSILGDSYGKILQNGELKLRFEAETGHFWLDYHEHTMPINPNAYPSILGHRLAILEARLGKQHPAFLEYRSVMSALEHLPVEVGESTNPNALNAIERKEERAREGTIARHRLSVLCAQTPEIAQFIIENVQDYHSQNEDHTRLNRLHRLLEQQAYRLSNWRVASDEINYRRFFDVNDLVAIRVEDARVFHDTHALVMDLIGKGWVQGLRIDHPDGLYNPAAYFQRLQSEAAKRLDWPIPLTPWTLNAEDMPLYVLIEKILAPFERLPQEWAVHGTTGYEFTNLVTGIFIKQDKEAEFSRLYDRLLEQRMDFDLLIYRAKKLIMKTTLNSELGVLTQQLNRICKQNWSFRDFTLHNLREALMEIVASFPVYRTYVTAEQTSKKDREYVDWAVRLAKRRSRAIDTSIFDFIRSVLLQEASPEGFKTSASGKEEPSGGLAPDDETRQPIQPFGQVMTRFAMKFQQYTSPVMAKGVEDTSFYRYNRLIALNEVGGDPRQFGVSLATFHHQNSERARRMPLTLLATSTHDTKRSEDVRARLSVLSEMPELWQRHLSHWLRYHRHLKKTIEDGESAPSINDEYLFYQSLLGIWPLDEQVELHAFSPHPGALPEDALASLCTRMEQYMMKAVRESKTHTSWINPNEEYEEALSQYIRGVLLKPSHLFLDSFVPFQAMMAQYGLYNSLSQTLLKLTVPGIPDIYQGTELWDFSLVDPDNRRPVDYGRAWGWLEWQQSVLEARTPDVLNPLLNELWERMADGRIKQYLIAKVLRYRGEHLALFQHGSYIPLEVTGPAAEHVVAFARLAEDEQVIVLAPRLLFTLSGRHHSRHSLFLPGNKTLWGDSAIVLPEELTGHPLFNLFNRETVTFNNPDEGGAVTIPVAEILSSFPLGLLVQHL